MPPPCRLAALLAALALAPAALRGQPGWTEPVLLDARTALELARVRQDPTDEFIYLPVLFQNTFNSSIEVAVVDTTVDPPDYSTNVVAVGTPFALGEAHQVGDRIGFSYVDTSFDGQFGTCQVPCIPSHHLVSIGTFLDSASAASEDDYFVALVDNAANHAILTRYSTNGGTSWQTLHTTLPPTPGGVYPAFQGGKRLQLLVDPEGTDPATTRNCLLYETRPTPATTALRLHCRNGASSLEGGGAFDVVLDADVPTPTNEFDSKIETSCVYRILGAAEQIFCAYSHRASSRVRLVGVDAIGTLDGPYDLSPTPEIEEVYGLSTLLLPNGDMVVVSPDPDGSTRVRTYSQGAGIFGSPGPDGTYLGTSSAEGRGPFNPDDPIEAFLWGFLTGSFSGGSLGQTTGLFLSGQRIPLFADGFETGNRLRWSGSNP